MSRSAAISMTDQLARSSRTGTSTLCWTRLAVTPRKRSARKRWPWVLIATRSQPFAHPADDLVDRIAVGELGLGGDARGRELGAHALEVGGVLADLRADRVGAEGPRRPAGRDVEQHDAAAGVPGQPLDVLDDRAVRLRGVQGDEDGLVHGVVCGSSWFRGFAVVRAARGRDGDQPPPITCHAVLTDSGRP